MGFGIEHIAVPYAVGGLAFAEIYKQSKDGAGGDPYELALRGIAGLIVETTEHMLGGAAVVVLNKVKVQTHIAKCLTIPCFHKEASGIAKDFWFQQPGIMNFGWNFFHKVEPRITRIDTNEELTKGRVSLGPSLQN